mmetsp:Transcript_15714/g.36343  ORF Transcript_15714/g.36343 Transcript_15714/m.36343 type:complete len:167 (-) Transcript_15714:953-1453(-)
MATQTSNGIVLTPERDSKSIGSMVIRRIPRNAPAVVAQREPTRSSPSIGFAVPLRSLCADDDALAPRKRKNNKRNECSALLDSCFTQRRRHPRHIPASPTRTTPSSILLTSRKDKAAFTCKPILSGRNLPIRLNADSKDIIPNKKTSSLQCRHELTKNTITCSRSS